MNLNTAKLRLLAYRKGLKQKQIAEATALSLPTINTIFNGRSCSKESAEKIAEALGVALDQLIAK